MRIGEEKLPRRSVGGAVALAAPTRAASLLPLSEAIRFVAAVCACVCVCVFVCVCV